MSLSALIFDVDGTLAETDDVHRAAYNEAFADFGLSWTWTRSNYSRLLAVDDGPKRLFAHAREFQPGFLSVFGDSDVFDRVYERKSEHYARLLSEDAAPLRPGVARLINEALADDVVLAIATMNRRQEAEQLIFALLGPEAFGWFDVVVTGDDMKPVSRPQDAYRAALERLRLPAAQVIAIDDSARGVRGAAALGLGVVATPGIYTSSEKFDDAWIVLSDLGRPAEPFNILRGPQIPHDFITIEALEALQRQFLNAA